MVSVTVVGLSGEGTRMSQYNPTDSTIAHSWENFKRNVLALTSLAYIHTLSHTYKINK